MRWWVKCAVDNLKGIIPAQNAIRRWKRQMCGYRANTRRDEGNLEEGLRMLQFIGMEHVRGACCLEVGSGWEPIIPILFSLAGAQRVIMTDLNRLMNAETFAAALSAVDRYRDRIIATLQNQPQSVGCTKGLSAEMRFRRVA